MDTVLAKDFGWVVDHVLIVEQQWTLSRIRLVPKIIARRWIGTTLECIVTVDLVPRRTI